MREREDKVWFDDGLGSDRCEWWDWWSLWRSNRLECLSRWRWLSCRFESERMRFRTEMMISFWSKVDKDFEMFEDELMEWWECLMRSLRIS